MASTAALPVRRESTIVQFSTRRDSQAAIAATSSDQVQERSIVPRTLVRRERLLTPLVILALQILLIVLIAVFIFVLIGGVTWFAFDVESQVQLRTLAQQSEKTAAATEYGIRCVSPNWVWRYFSQSECAELARVRDQIPGLGITRIGVAIELLNGFAIIPWEYVNMLRQVAWDIMMMCCAPGLVLILWRYSSLIGGGLGSFFGPYIGGVCSLVAEARRFW